MFRMDSNETPEPERDAQDAARRRALEAKRGRSTGPMERREPGQVRIKFKF